jgi:hypothetical protein
MPVKKPLFGPPTKKWYAQVVGGLAAIAVVFLESGDFNDVEKGMLGTLLSAAVLSYFKSNDATSTGDGVPS